MGELFSIGDLAARTGLPVKVIRHWSDVGVVPPTIRTASGYRRYDAGALARLELARTLRDLGLGLTAIRGVVDRERTVAEAAAVHADAIETQVRTLRLQQAVLRSVSRRGATAAELADLTRLARLSARERTAVIHDFVTAALGDLDVPTYRAGLLAATPDLPEQPSPEQLDAWIELAALVRTPRLHASLARIARYAAEHAPGEHDERAVAAARDVTDLWVRRVTAAIDGGIMTDSPAADPVVADIVAAWLPTQAGTGVDGAPARRLLLEQLEVAADRDVERYWQLLCVINGWPVPASLQAPGRWLMTALRANPAPGARAAGIAALLAEEDPDPAWLLPACERVLAEVEELVAAVPAGRLGAPTPCAGWDVRALLEHLVWENLLWTSLAAGAPRADFAADHLGDDHVAAFRAASRDTLAAFRRPGMLSQRYGEAPGWRLVEQVVVEMLVHGWDLATATGRPTDLAPDVADAMLPAVRAMYGPLPRTSAGSFGPEQPCPEGATAADRLAAYLGRVTGPRA
ncbi:TIGR03086 family protein [Dactylosporangium aurantiacum]|uniref:TIGR03086 family protein n=1 Tax=Dactylosporangium aurantiacum TaxID=35754 RepID=A0A9Q9IN02_9ACTN|nr:TIGR03086 family metal-binding protein [Dactylosporangium aurantiacum]MDG6108621.1 TIGR03086 family metal-binding protein [Dactylosporangium aurantiacum]UWZ59159.1 TIGR03086 family protein [Dactylosporangium aurantiacum]